MSSYMNKVCGTSPLEPLIGSLFKKGLSDKSIRLRQDEVKGRCNFIGKRQEKVIAMWNAGVALGATTFTNAAVNFPNAAADQYANQDWTALGVVIE